MEEEIGEVVKGSGTENEGLGVMQDEMMTDHQEGIGTCLMIEEGGVEDVGVIEVTEMEDLEVDLAEEESVQRAQVLHPRRRNQLQI